MYVLSFGSINSLFQFNPAILVLSINSLASMFCGIFLIWTVMLKSFWTTEMVIKTISDLKRILIKLILIKEELEKACPGVVTCADIVQRWHYASLFFILNLPTLSLSFKVFLLISEVLSPKGFSNSFRLRI